MTVIRGQHPVDGHYYANLDSYLGEFEPVRIPDPEDFDEVLAGHVVTEYSHTLLEIRTKTKCLS